MRISDSFLPVLLLALCATASMVTVLAPSWLLQPLAAGVDDPAARVHALAARRQWLALALVVIGGWLFARAWGRGDAVARALAIALMLVLLANGLFSGRARARAGACISRPTPAAEADTVRLLTVSASRIRGTEHP